MSTAPISDPYKLPPSGILVVGGDSLVGNALVRHFQAVDIPVKYTSRRAHKESPDCIPFDLLRPIGLSASPEVAIICVGVTDTKQCHEYPAETRSLNVDATLQAASKLYLGGAHIIFLSSSQSIIGYPLGSVSNSPLPAPTELGRQKFEAERGILALGDRATVLRATKVISCKSTLISSWLIRLRNAQEITPLLDFYFCPISLRTMVAAVAKLAYTKMPGLFNLSGAAPLTYSDFAYQLAATMNVNKSMIAPKSALDLNIPPYYPRALTCLDMTGMTAASGVLPQSVVSVISDLLMEFSIYQSPAIRSTYTLCENE